MNCTDRSPIRRINQLNFGRIPDHRKFLRFAGRADVSSVAAAEAEALASHLSGYSPQSFSALRIISAIESKLHTSFRTLSHSASRGAAKDHGVMAGYNLDQIFMTFREGFKAPFVHTGSHRSDMGRIL
jgi:hypothetical protein